MRKKVTVLKRVRSDPLQSLVNCENTFTHLFRSSEENCGSKPLKNGFIPLLLTYFDHVMNGQAGALLSEK